MRIAVFIKSTTFNKNYGGLETQNKLLCEGLARVGHDVVIFAPAPEKLSQIPNSKFQITNKLQNSKSKSKIPNSNGPNSRLVVVGNLRDANVDYIFVDSPAGRYSKKWFRGSTRVFRELHEKDPFDAVISQSMAGQGVIGYLKAGNFSTAAGEAPGASAEPALGAGECGGETLLKELSKEKASDSPKSGFKTGPKAGLFSSPACIVIQHGTILGELKTRWKALEAFQILNFKFSILKKEKRSGRTGLTWSVVKDWLFFFFLLIPYAIKIYIQDQIRLRRADKVIAVSDLVKQSLMKEYFLPEEKVEVVYNGIDAAKFQDTIRQPADKSQIREEIGVREGEKVLLYVGRIEKEKGLGKLLRAVSNIKSQSASWRTNFKLIVVGDGEYLNELKELAKELGIADKVIFTGNVPYEEVPRYYAAADVFVLPSLRQEGLPMTLPEAMASGLPVAASEIGGIPNAVEDGKTGFLVEPGNVEELSDTLITLFSDDKLMKNMSEQAKKIARARFSQKAMVENTLDVIHVVVNN